ncbi:MAG: hypothetical protein EB060_12285, partial [Proteobacteria bacterium]|nr:hypothetical protein [Pseudomonadota bacterium]
MMADASSQIAESNEANNLISLPINVIAGSSLPDIFLTSATVSASTVTVGQSVTISTIQNCNPFPTATSYATLQYRFSIDATWESTDTFIGSDISTFTATIAAEAENITYTIPNSPGVRYILLQCDASNTTAESNENNNVVAIPITIVAAAIDAPGNKYGISTSILKGKIYPNPAGEKLFVEVSDGALKAAAIHYADGRLFRAIDQHELELGINVSALES